MQKEPTTRDLQRDIQDLKDVINAFATGTQTHFERIEGRLDGMDQQFEKIDQRFERMDQRFSTIEGRTGRIETGMVTKSYFDVRFGTLVDLLADHRVITPSEAKRVLS